MDLQPYTKDLINIHGLSKKNNNIHGRLLMREDKVGQGLPWCAKVKVYNKEDKSLPFFLGNNCKLQISHNTNILLGADGKTLLN